MDLIQKTIVLLIFLIKFDEIFCSITPDFGKNVWQMKFDSIPLPLTQCYKDNQKLMDRCVDQSFDSWRYYHKLDYASDRELARASCCAMWDAKDCQMSTANTYCTREAVQELYVLWDEAILTWTRSNQCDRYSLEYNSANCKLKDWAIALIVLSSLLILFVVIFVTFKYIKRNKTQKTIKFHSINYNKP